jgi:hypothetical protein
MPLLSFVMVKFESPNCVTALNPVEFVNITIQNGDIRTPQIMIDRSMNEIPLGTRNFKLNVVRSSALFGKPATFAW